MLFQVHVHVVAASPMDDHDVRDAVDGLGPSRVTLRHGTRPGAGLSAQSSAGLLVSELARKSYVVRRYKLSW